MIKKAKQLNFEESLASLRSLSFDVQAVPGVANQMLVAKHGCAAVLAAVKDAPAAFVMKPGFVLGGEISRLLDRGFQKFLKTSKLEIPATADRLRAVHQFSEELKQVTGTIDLYNEALGTVSQVYMYDRVKSRDLPEAQRPVRPWQLPG